MRIKTAKLLSAFFAALIILVLLNFSALAAGSAELELPVSIKISTKDKAPDTTESFVLRLKTADESAPMPEGKTGGSFDLSLEGEGYALLPAIKYERVGVYHYELSLVPGKNPAYKYDKRVYSVTVSISNSEDGSLRATVAMREGDSGDKQDCAEFVNLYDKNPPVKTGVRDMWRVYLLGCAELLCISGSIIWLLRHSEEEENASY